MPKHTIVVKPKKLYNLEPQKKHTTEDVLSLHNKDSFLSQLQVQPLDKQFQQVQTTILTRLPISTDIAFASSPIFQGTTIDLGSVALILVRRLNSNIYKNIFPETVTDMEYINTMIDSVPTTTNDIVQANHELSVGDVVYLDTDGTYQKALAEDSARAKVEGMVVKVASPNVFTLMTTGTMKYKHLEYNDTSVLYLSDKEPGKLSHYQDIENTVYVPVALYTNDSIIISIQQGSIGDKLLPYTVEELDFESYSRDELNDVVNLVVGGVK